AEPLHLPRSQPQLPKSKIREPGSYFRGSNSFIFLLGYLPRHSKSETCPTPHWVSCGAMLQRQRVAAICDEPLLPFLIFCDGDTRQENRSRSDHRSCAIMNLVLGPEF